MQIVDFATAHIEQAMQIAKQNYEDERHHVSALPPIETVPDLAPYVENGLGVAAFEGDNMTGFLCAIGPFKNAFRSTDVIGVFSPMGAHGAIGGNRANTYAYMYQAAGEKWACAGAASHAVCLYAHEREIQEQFFRYGFGLRCIDAIRSMNGVDEPLCEGYEFAELTSDEFIQVLPLVHMLDAHMAASPSFILRPSDTEESFVNKVRQCHPTILVAKKNGQIVAYLRAEREGETFLCKMDGYAHVMGAFCLPEHRGKGLHQKLLYLMIQNLNAQGYTRFGVDFESINPAAYCFWLKHFDAFTHSVVRRIDESAVKNRLSTVPCKFVTSYKKRAHKIKQQFYHLQHLKQGVLQSL